LPVPDAPDVMVSHGVVVVAVQVQPGCVFTLKESLPPPNSNSFDVGESVYVQLAVAVCETETFFPATLNEPLREVVPLFAAAVYETVPSPVPDAPELIVSHGVVVVAVHAQLLPVVTATVAGPPALVKLCDVGVTV
jgi:hypothetical protein